MPADLGLTGLQISTNQRTTRKQLWGSVKYRTEYHAEKSTTHKLCKMQGHITDAKPPGT